MNEISTESIRRESHRGEQAMKAGFLIHFLCSLCSHTSRDKGMLTFTSTLRFCSLPSIYPSTLSVPQIPFRFQYQQILISMLKIGYARLFPFHSPTLENWPPPANELRVEHAIEEQHMQIFARLQALRSISMVSNMPSNGKYTWSSFNNSINTCISIPFSCVVNALEWHCLLSIVNAVYQKHIRNCRITAMHLFYPMRNAYFTYTNIAFSHKHSVFESISLIRARYSAHKIPIHIHKYIVCR